MSESRIKQLERVLEESNISYRLGNPIMSDTEYDALLEELEVLDPNNILLTKIGHDIVDDSRKEKIPIIMASMNKVKTLNEIILWMVNKHIPKDTKLVLTPKYDGASLCVNEKNSKAWTRGNGIEGQRSDKHLEKTGHKSIVTDSEKLFTFGEVMMKRKTFIEKYSEEFSNPRNLVSGQLNHKTPNIILEDCFYIKYGIESELSSNQNKSDQLDWLNKYNQIKVPYKIVTYHELSEDYLKNLFDEWSEDFEIDGIIIEVDDHVLREQLGRETSSNNPCYARAYKGSFEEVKESKVTNINWQISKKGLLKPVIQIETIVLDGVNVTNVTGNNARFMKEMGIGINSIVKVKRSGMVIPLIVSVEYSTGFEYPEIDGVQYDWNDNGVELVTTNITDQQKLRQLISFFEILEVENMGEGIVKQFFDNGFDTAEKILSMTKEDMMKMEKFGERKAQKVLKSIDDKRNVTLSKLQHASGFFDNLGSKKLLLLENLENCSVEHIKGIEGFSDISAENYLKGIVQYNEWVNKFDGLLNISKTESKEPSSNGLENMTFVFTGVRRKDLNEIIESKGGSVANSISKNTTHLIMKQKGSGSSKEKKAVDLGQTIWEVEELENFLKNI